MQFCRLGVGSISTKAVLSCTEAGLSCSIPSTIGSLWFHLNLSTRKRGSICNLDGTSSSSPVTRLPLIILVWHLWLALHNVMPRLVFCHAYLLETKMKPPSICCCEFFAAISQMCLLLMACWIMSTGVRNYGLVQEIEGAGAGPQIEG